MTHSQWFAPSSLCSVSPVFGDRPMRWQPRLFDRASALAASVAMGGAFGGVVGAVLGRLVALALMSLVLALALAGCRPERPACRPEQLARIEAAYVAEAVAACAGYDDVVTCPAIPQLDAKYNVLREEWVACQ